MGVRCCVVGSLLGGGSSPLGGGCSPLLHILLKRCQKKC